MSESPLTYEDALAWIADHPTGDLKSFAGQAHQLGERSLTAMVEVLRKGNDDQRRVAASVLVFNGATIESDGDSPEDFRYLVTLPDGHRHTVHPLYLTAEDFKAPPVGAQPIPDSEPGFFKRAFLHYAAYAVVAGALAFGASQTSGMACLLLAILAGLVAAVTLWSLVLVGGLWSLVGSAHRAQKDGPRTRPMSPPPGVLPDD